jgi:hypothetical protein
MAPPPARNIDDFYDLAIWLVVLFAIQVVVMACLLLSSCCATASTFQTGVGLDNVVNRNNVPMNQNTLNNLNGTAVNNRNAAAFF